MKKTNNAVLKIIVNRFEEENTAILTSQEIKVLKYIFNGLSTDEIAEVMNLSKRTIEVHRYNILKKTKSKSHIQLINKLLPPGWVDEILPAQ